MRVVVLVVGFVLGSISFAAAQSKPLADLANYRGADREEILKAGAKKEGKLIWYTSLTAHRDIANVFEAKYPGVKVETYRAGPSDLTRRLLSEAQSKRGIADIIETTPPTLIMLRDEKLLMPYSSPYLAAYPEEAKEEVDKARVYWATDRESMISPGAFGPGRPFRDVWVSPDHALFVNGVLVPARYLVNGRTIRQEPRDEVTYWHVELPGHNVLYAEGVPAESYLDTGNRGAFANAGPVMHLHPNFARYVWQTQGCAPLVVCGANVAAAKRRLLARAELLGHATTDEPNLTVVWANVRKLRAEADGRTWRVRIPRTARTLRLVSRTWIPAHLEPDNDDLRTLGVAITRLWLDAREAALDSPAFASGWHAPELEWRWTDGNAVLAVSGVRELVFEMATAKGTYWRDNESAVARAA